MNPSACILLTVIFIFVGRAYAQEPPATLSAKSLLKLAEEKFVRAEENIIDLTAAERLMFENAEKGEEAKCDFKDGEQVIHADRIEWLCTDPQAKQLVSHRGIQVNAACIDGKLDLQSARIPFPLYFLHCTFTGPIVLMYAEVRGLYLNGSHTKSITADGIKVDGGVFLNEGFSAEGEIRLLGASISSNFQCNNGTFCNPCGDALSADGVEVDGSVVLKDGFSATGKVRLPGASIGGNLDCEDGTFINPGKDALSAQGANVAGSVLLRNGFRAQGSIRLLGASIGGNLDCEDGTISNPDGKALNADRVKVEGYVFLRNGFSAEGEVCLLCASIGGNLECSNGTFSNPHGKALNADGVKVEGGVVLRDGFEARGRVSFAVADMGQHFQWHGVKSPETTTMDLRFAKVGTLWDEVESWPESGNLYLHGLVYEHLSREAPSVVESRIEWLRRQPQDAFSPQPYAQLAKVLEDQGNGEAAKDILIAKNEDPAFRKGMSWLYKRWYCIYGMTTGYGHRPLKALPIGLLIIGIGSMLFWLGFKADGVMAPTSKDIPVYAQPNALVYSFDLFMPLIELRQATLWEPDPSKTSRVTIGYWKFKLSIPINGYWLLWWMRIEILFGWILTTLFAVGLTGLVRS